MGEMGRPAFLYDALSRIVRVKNLNWTPANLCNCASWLDHWENFSKQVTRKCVVIGCDNNYSVGGHVQNESGIDKSWYVIPICSECNNKRGQVLEINDAVNLVPADISLTCG